MKKNIIGIVGSLREKSFNKLLMRAAIELTPEDMEIELVSIRDFPLFNQDDETERYPEGAQILKEKIKNADGVLFATPEYNRTIPGVLKNAIDWLSRPYGTSPFSDKPVFVIGASHGQIGTALSQYNLKQALLFLNARIMGQPEFYMSFADNKVDVNGNITDKETLEYLGTALASFSTFIA